ncbi:MAG TPA: 30S ribosomal protein S16 [Candidatus Mailhella merdavium]|nr:30S ribosomal protein S16 [Candidatus Mailhella merdavium]
MSVKVRLTRSGSKKHPFYRVVAINSDSRRDGRPLEFLGYYNPNTNPADVKIDQEKIDKWLANGAEMSDTVRSLYKKLPR